MARRILVVPCGPEADATSVCLGLVHALGENRTDVTYVKPIAQPSTSGDDSSGEVFRMVTTLRPPPPVDAERARRLLAAGAIGTLMEEVVALSLDEMDAHEVTVFEGLRPGLSTYLTDQVNRELAAALDADVLLVVSACDLPARALAEQAAAVGRPFTGRDGNRVVGVVLDRLGADSAPAGEHDAALAARDLRPVGHVTDQAHTARPRVADIVRELGVEVLNEGDPARRVGSIVIAAQSAPGFLELFTDGALVLVPGDRPEVLMAAALAEMKGIRLAGLLLTVGIAPDPQILDLAEPALASGLPVLLSAERTFPSAAAVMALDTQIPSDDEDRARRVMTSVAGAFDAEWVRELPVGGRERRMSAAQARADAVRALGRGRYDIALADGTDPVCLAASARWARLGGVRCHLVGDPSVAASTARDLGIDLPAGVRVIDPARPGAELIEHLARIRGIDEATARAALRDPLVVAYALAATGGADGVIGGVADAACIGLADDIVGRLDGPEGIATTVTALMTPDDASVWADTVLHETPDAAELAQIALRAAEGAAAVGLDPRVAFIAPPVLALDRAERTACIQEALQIMVDRRPDLPCAGPLEYATASSPSAARAAGLDGDVAGAATVYVFSGRRHAQDTFATVRRTTGADVIGPILYGYTKPLSSMPRDARLDDLMNLIGITALQSTWR